MNAQFLAWLEREPIAAQAERVRADLEDELFYDEIWGAGAYRRDREHLRDQ